MMDKRRELTRASCLSQAFRDFTLPDILERQRPLQRLAESVATDLEFGCPEAYGDLTLEQKERIKHALQTLDDLIALAGSAEDYSPTELFLMQIRESLRMAG